MKRKRNAGQEYVNSRGVAVKSKCVQKYDCGGCRYKCKEKVTEANRELIFHSYWQLGRKDLQNDFITAHVQAHKKSSGNANSRKQMSRAYYLTVDGTRVRVCKEFFLKTLFPTNLFITVYQKCALPLAQPNLTREVTIYQGIEFQMQSVKKSGDIYVVFPRWNLIIVEAKVQRNTWKPAFLLSRCTDCIVKQKLKDLQ